jgi:hypothetical protein
MVLVDSHGISRVPRYSGTRRESAHCRLRGSHPLWPIVPDRSTNALIDHSLVLHPDRPYNPTVQARWFGLFRVRSPLLAESLLFSSPPGTEMVHFPGLPSPPYEFRWRYSGITLSGLPHSEILGSKPVCGSPKLIAAYHVLHRLLAPRHSPYALSSLTIRNSKLTMTVPRLRSPSPVIAHWKPATGNRQRSPTAPYTLRVCGRKKLPFAGYSVVKERCRSCSPDRPAAVSRRERHSTRRASFSRTCHVRITLRRMQADLLPPPRRRLRARQGLVENTGLEPVTSWLQTRRSPS